VDLRDAARYTIDFLAPQKHHSRLAIISYVRPILRSEVIPAREIIIHHRISGLIGRRVFSCFLFFFFFSERTESDRAARDGTKKGESALVIKMFSMFLASTQRDAR
jgi:hypothetical protein